MAGKQKCPICSGDTVADFKPFCSRRCADVDLARWLGGSYAIAIEDDSDEDGEQAARQPEADPDDTRH